MEKIQKLVVIIIALIPLLSFNANVYGKTIELKFREDKLLLKKYFATTSNKSNSEQIYGREVYFSEFDLNNDGTEEYIIKTIWDKRNFCPISDKPTCIEIAIYDNEFKSLSPSYGGYESQVLVSDYRVNNYYNVILVKPKLRNERNAKFSVLKFSKRSNWYTN